MQEYEYTSLRNAQQKARTPKQRRTILNRYLKVIAKYRNGTSRDDQFDTALATSCTTGLWAALGDNYRAEKAYRESIRLFDEYGSPFFAASMSMAFAEFLLGQKRFADANFCLSENIRYLTKYSSKNDWHVKNAEEILTHYELTREIISRHHYRYCEPCGIDETRAGTKRNEKDGSIDKWQD